MSAHLHAVLDEIKEEFKREGALGPGTAEKAVALLVEILCELDDISRLVREMSSTPSIIPGRLQ